VRHYAYVAIAIVMASAVISTALIFVTPTLQGTKTATETSIASSVQTSISVYQPCDNYVWNASSSTPNNGSVPVLLMRPNSTGYICVVYQTAWQGNQSLYQSDSMYNSYPFLVNGTYQFRPFLVDNYRCSTANGISSCVQTTSHSFKITVLPDSIRPSASMNYVTVIFTVNALSNSTGFYDESAPWTACVSMPMAVGYSVSQVNASDFTHPPGSSCPVQLFVPVAEYVTGMNVTYVNRLVP
jgi:hypothetical protein